MFTTELSEIIDKITSECYVTSDDHFGHKNIIDFMPARLSSMIRDGYLPEDFKREDIPEEKLLKIHDDFMVDKFNSVVSKDDTTLFLGDFAFKGLDIAKRLNGYKILILGNHDRKGSQTYDQAGFDHVVRGLVIKEDEYVFVAQSSDKLMSALLLVVNNKRILFNHYPPTEEEFRYHKDENEELTKPSILNDRIDEVIKIYYKFDCDFVFHGHTHDRFYSSPTINFINCCRDANNHLPKKIKYFLGGKNGN